MNETKLALQRAFIKVYIDRSFEKMTVKEVCIEAPVARTTFYEHYENLAEIKSEIEDVFISEIVELAKKHHIEDKSNDPTDFFADVMDYIKANWDMNYAFLVARPNLDYMEKWKGGIKYDFKLRFPELVEIQDYELISEVLASGLLSAYIYWMKHPEEMGKGQILNLASKELKNFTDDLRKPNTF